MVYTVDKYDPKERGNGLFTKDDVIFRHTSEEAERDGIFFNVDKIFKPGLISHVTTNLMHQGYFKEGGEELNMSNLLDLLNNSIYEMKKQSPDDVVQDFYAFKIEFPDGQTREVYAGKNEYGRITLMLPEDY